MHNKATIIGRVGKDPVARGTGSITTFSVATTRKFKSSDGERREITHWHNVVIFDERTAKYAVEYISKGDLVLVEGAYESRDYEQNGENRRVYELVVRPYNGSVSRLSKSGSGSSDRDDDRPSRSESRSSNTTTGSGYTPYGDDDEIPF